VERFRGLRNFAIVALVALAIALAPGGGTGLSVVLWILTVAFFTAIALLGYRLYREHRFTIDSLSALERWVLYGSVGLAFLTFTGTNLAALEPVRVGRRACTGRSGAWPRHEFTLP